MFEVEEILIFYPNLPTINVKLLINLPSPQANKSKFNNYLIKI